MSNLKYGAIMPHPPILVPEIGGPRVKEIDATQKAAQKVAREIKALNPDTIVVITPHGAVAQYSVPVYTGHIFEGNFSNFGCDKLTMSFKGDAAFGLALVKNSRKAGIETSQLGESWLDHGVLVPMYYPLIAGVKSKLLPIAIAMLPLAMLFEFGRVIRKTAEETGRKIVIIASADMSHRLTKDAPSGYDPRGKEFDQKLVELVKKNDVDGIINFDPKLADQAGQDSLWSIAMLLGALDGLIFEHEVLSYEGPFGVGYMVAEYKVKS